MSLYEFDSLIVESVFCTVATTAPVFCPLLLVVLPTVLPQASANVIIMLRAEIKIHVIFIVKYIGAQRLTSYSKLWNRQWPLNKINPN